MGVNTFFKRLVDRPVTSDVFLSSRPIMISVISASVTGLPAMLNSGVLG